MHIVGGAGMRINGGFTVRTLGGFHANTQLSLAELTLTAFNRPPDLAMVSRAKVAGLAFRGHRH